MAEFYIEYHVPVSCDIDDFIDVLKIHKKNGGTLENLSIEPIVPVPIYGVYSDGYSDWRMNEGIPYYKILVKQRDKSNLSLVN